MNAEREKDFDLIGRYLGGRATAQEVQSLEQRLSADAELRQEFLRYAHVDSALTTMVRPSAQMPLAAAKKRQAMWQRPMLRWAAAAAVLIVGVMMWRQDGINVRVLASSAEVTSPWAQGSSVRAREVTLTQGSVQLQLDSGVTLDLAAPVQLRLDDPMHATLLAGNVTADVGEHGKGFVVETASTRVVDLGTRFGVSLSAGGDTDVAVFQGKVEVFGKQQPKQRASLSAGEAVRVHPSATARRLVCINTRGESFAVLTPPPPDALVTDVSDNVADSGNYAFYTIQTRQMRAGARPYSTLGKPRWQAMPGETFPQELLGADVIGTFSPDRNDPNLELSLQVSRPCAVYLMLDERADVPAWVKRDFTVTSLRILSGPWADNPVVQGMTADANGELHVQYRVWKREVSQPGIVKLGAPYPDAATARHRAMYGIAVRKK